MQTIFLLAFWIYLLGIVALSWGAGNRYDRRVISIIIGAALASSVAHHYFVFPTAHVLVLLIDLSLLAVVSRYAMRSERYWPILFAGLLLAICCFSIAGVFIPVETLRLDLMGGLWATVALTAMTVSLLMDRRKVAKAS